MIRAIPFLVLAAFPVAPVLAQPVPAPAVPAADWLQQEDESFRPLPLHEAAERVTARYDGRLISAETVPPLSSERDLGAELVYRFRLLTGTRQALDIRMDARDGRFLEVLGRGQMAARRR